MKRETCFHCEPDEARRQWLDRYSACARCKDEQPPPAYDARQVRGTLKGLFPARGRGIRQVSDVELLANRLDVEQALMAMVREHMLEPIEANVVVWRFVKQRTVEAVAAAIGCSESSVKRATRSALAKIRDFLNRGA